MFIFWPVCNTLFYWWINIMAVGSPTLYIANGRFPPPYFHEVFLSQHGRFPHPQKQNMQNKTRLECHLIFARLFGKVTLVLLRASHSLSQVNCPTVRILHPFAPRFSCEFVSSSTKWTMPVALAEFCMKSSDHKIWSLLKWYHFGWFSLPRCCSVE